MTYDGGRRWVRDLGGNEIQVPEEGEGPGGGVSNPLTEDLVTGGNGIVGGLAFTKARLMVNPDEGAEVGGMAGLLAGMGGVGLPGGNVTIEGGDGNDGGDPGASITVGGGSGDGETSGVITVVGGITNVVSIFGPGGENGLNLEDGAFYLSGADAAAGLPGGAITIAAGDGDGGNDPGASITVGGGSGDGTAGSIGLTGELNLGDNDVIGAATIASGPTDDDVNRINMGAGDILIRGAGGPADLGGLSVTITGGDGDAGADPGATLTVGGGSGDGSPGIVSVNASGSSVTVGAGIGLSASSGIAITSSGDDIVIDADTNLIFPGLPAADPHVVGALYTTAGALMVSAG